MLYPLLRFGIESAGGGDGIDCAQAGKGVKIMVMVEGAGLPVAVDAAPANPHNSQLVQQLSDSAAWTGFGTVSGFQFICQMVRLR